MQIEFKDLKKIREKHKDQIIVYTSGSFDMTHVGHILFFEDCKKYGDILVISIGSDSIIKALKGKSRPFLNQAIRLKTVDSLKPVDYCFLDCFSTAESPYEIFEPVFRELMPNKYVVNEDAHNLQYRREISQKFGIEMIVLKRECPKEFEDISTTNIIQKIKLSE